MEATTATEVASNSALAGNGMLYTILYVVVIFAVFYFLLIRPQKKREKETRAMLDAMQVGDEIVTIGGIMGRVVSIKEDSVVIESGADKNKIKFERGAIKSVLTVHE
ncbi:MAG: preprotein translocase subunit YajC [Clostridia bacterium]|nr:preprotein translocase subunit YajC [Clostridia bacterium]